MARYIRNRDGAEVPETEAMAGGMLRDGYRTTDMLGPGEYARFNVMMVDGGNRVTFRDGSAFLRDSTGTPLVLHDERTGGQMKLNEDLIKAIEAEAGKLGMSVHDYVQHVLKYSWSAAKLSGAPNAGSPAAEAMG